MTERATMPIKMTKEIVPSDRLKIVKSGCETECAQKTVPPGNMVLRVKICFSAIEVYRVWTVSNFNFIWTTGNNNLTNARPS